VAYPSPAGQRGIVNSSVSALTLLYFLTAG
jgi:hypothetical protein